jgi:TRAP transporter TAXI family solute receptor
MIAKNPPMYFRRPSFFRRVPIICLFLIVGVCMPPFSANAFDVLLGTGEPGTFSHFTGRVLCRVINSHASDMNCQTVPTPDDVYNLTNLQGGSLDIGLVDSHMLYDAVNKAEKFEYLDISYVNLRSLMPLYDVPVTLVVRKDAKITSLAGLKNKRINAGSPGSSQFLAVSTILKAKNWSKKDFSLVQELPASHSQDTMAFCHGEIQAMVHIGIHPNPELQQLFKLCEADMLNMDDDDIQKMITGHHAFSKMNITAGIYPTHPGSVTTFGTSMMLVSSSDLDEETVYKIIDALYRGRKYLKSAHPALGALAVSSSDKPDAGVKLHPGAVKYFTEQ